MKRYIMLLMGHVSHYHRRICGSVFQNNAITRSMPFMLDFLSNHDGCIQRELAAHCHLDPASVTNALNLMESEGYIYRQGTPEDKRALRVYLTDLGREKALVVDSTHAALEEVSFSGFTKEERERFTLDLKRIHDNLRDWEAARQPERT